MTLTSIKAQNLKKGDLLKSAFNMVEVVSVNVRNKTTLIEYKSTYDGYISEKPWRFYNNEIVRINK